MEVANTDVLVDYAMPCMKAEWALKAAHTAALEKNFEEAIQQAKVAAVEARMLQIALMDMQERGK